MQCSWLADSIFHSIASLNVWDILWSSREVNHSRWLCDQGHKQNTDRNTCKPFKLLSWITWPWPTWERSGSPATGPLAMINASYNRLDNLGVTSQNADFQRYMFPNVSKMFTLYINGNGPWLSMTQSPWCRSKSRSTLLRVYWYPQDCQSC